MQLLFRTFLIFSIILPLTFSPSVAQVIKSHNNYTYSIGGNIGKGFIIKHDNRMGHLAQSHPDGFSLFVKKHTFGHKDWEKALNYPDIGITFDYFDFNNPLLGKAFAATSFLDYYIIRKPYSSVNFQFGVGLSYTTNPYNPTTNNKNIALGSAFAYALRAQLSYNQRILEQLQLILALRISHYSNGAFKMPNKGVNVPTADIGLSYTLNKGNIDYQHFTTHPTVDKSIKYNIFFATGLKEIDRIKNKKFPFLTFSIYASKQTSLVSSFNLGVDGFYSMATKEEIRTDRELEEKEQDFKRIGIAGGHELHAGKLSLLTQIGVYVYRPYKADQPIYQRYGLKYTFSDQIFGGIFLKTHYGKAEAVEWGVGIKI